MLHNRLESRKALGLVPEKDRTTLKGKRRDAASKSAFVFCNGDGERYVSTSINHMHRAAFASKAERQASATLSRRIRSALASTYNAY